MILITHDRSLMELVADRLWLAADGTVQPFDGDMEDYAKFVLDRARVAARAPTQVQAEAPAAKPSAKPATTAVGPLKRRLEAAEVVLARETKALAEIDAALADPKLFFRDPDKIAELTKRREKTQAAVDKAEATWIDAAEAYETAKALT